MERQLEPFWTIAHFEAFELWHSCAESVNAHKGRLRRLLENNVQSKTRINEHL